MPGSSQVRYSFTSPFVSVMLLLELAQSRYVVSLAFLVIQAAAALLGFAVFFAVGGFSSLLASLSLPDYQLELWHFAAAAVIAIGCHPGGRASAAAGVGSAGRRHRRDIAGARRARPDRFTAGHEGCPGHLGVGAVLGLQVVAVRRVRLVLRR